MQFIQFDHRISKLESFDTIGYDVENEVLTIKFFNGEESTYYHVPEQKIFHWLLTNDKEKYYQQIIKPYPNKKEG